MWYVLLVFIVVIGICSLIAKSSAWKGKSGERAVKSVLGQTTPGFQYVLNDYIIVQDGFIKKQPNTMLKRRPL